MGLLRRLGYSNLRHYRGGIGDWMERGEAVERLAPPLVDVPLVPGQDTAARPRERSLDGSHRRQWATAFLDAIDSRPTSQLFLFWLAMVVLCGVAYWLAALLGYHGLVAGRVPIGFTAEGLATAIYFSFVTATSVGYGDVVPVGATRVLAIAEAVTGLLVFGAVVAKFVSRRQDTIVREIHRVTFEERLDRVQTNLHLVLSELQAIATMCDDGTVRPERVSVRLESAAMVFAGELRAIHDLLYRPQRAPAEPVLEAILAALAGAFRELTELLACLPTTFVRSTTLDGSLRVMARLADEICGECVPHAYAPALTMWMDRVQEAARRIA